MDIRELQGYASFFMTIFLIAIDDEIDSTPVEDKPASQRYKEEKKK